MNDNIKAIEKSLKGVPISDYVDCTCRTCGSSTVDINIDYEDLSAALYALGYRKQSDTVKEFAEKVKDVLDRKIRDHGTTNIHTLRTQSERLRIAYMCIDEIAASFGEWCPESASCATCERRNKTADLSSTILCSWLGNKTMNKTDYCSYYLAASFDKDGTSK